MTKETGVPKLKGATNRAIWLFRLERHITAKGTWDAVRFVPYKESTRQTTPPPIPRQSDDGKSVAPDGSSQPIKETIETKTPLPGQTETDLEKEKKPKFGNTTDYKDFDLALCWNCNHCQAHVTSAVIYSLPRLSQH